MSQKKDKVIINDSPSASVEKAKIAEDTPFLNCLAEIVNTFQMQDKDMIRKNYKMLCDIAPQTAIEEMLAVQMIGIHHATMKALANAHGSLSWNIVNAYMNSATKLARTFTMQMEALNRHRGKGQQKMTVEHVHVNAGGQAIIGTVQSQGKKKKGGGSNGGHLKK